MGKFKRIIAFTLVLSVVFASVLSIAAEEEATDVGIELNAEDRLIAKKLAALGIIDEPTDDRLKAYITRAELIDVLLKYLDYEDAVTTADTTPFIDVSAFDKRIGAYNLLYKAGYISGDGNSRYRPDDFLTYNEAMAVVVKAMGHKPFIMEELGYPESYMYVANKYGMLKDLRDSGENPIPYCDILRMIEKSLDADAVVQEGYDINGEGRLEIKDGFKVLEQIHGIKHFKGLVTGNENTRLYASGSEKIYRYQIEIDGEIYDTPEQEYDILLGYRVVAYSEKDENDELSIVYMEADRRKNNVFEIKADNIIKEKTTNTCIYYEDESVYDQELDIDADTFTVIYNGKSHNNYGMLKSILPDSGYVTALDNNGDMMIDVLFINEYKNMVIGSVDRANHKIYDKYTNEMLVIDPMDDDVRIYDVDGAQVGIGAIPLNSVISYTETANAEGYKLKIVYLQTEKFVGQIEEVSYEGDETKLLIGGMYYEMAENLKNYIELGLESELKTNVSGTFYLDRDGKIAYYDREEASSAIYGFVHRVAIDSGLGDKLIIRIFSQDAEWLVLETNGKINIDGYRYNTNSTADLETAISKIPEGEVIMFSYMDNIITYIDTPELNKGNTTLASDRGNLNMIASGAEFETRYGMCNEFNNPSDNKFVVNSGNCVIFETPARPTEGDEENYYDDLEMYSVSKSLGKAYYRAVPYDYGQVITDGYCAYNTESRDINVASCLLLRGSENAGKGINGSGGESLTTRSQCAVVIKTGAGLNKDGEDRQVLYYSVNGIEKKLCVANTINYSKCRIYNYESETKSFNEIGLEAGDVIQVGTNAKDEISQINVVYRFDQTSDLASEAYITYPAYKMQFGAPPEGMAIGEVAAVDSENKILQFAVGEDKYEIRTATANITVYDSILEKTSVANIGDLIEGDRVIVKADVDYAARASQILVIR